MRVALVLCAIAVLARGPVTLDGVVGLLVMVTAIASLSFAVDVLVPARRVKR